LELLGRSSPAPAQDIARRILGEDVTQVEYYTERVKRMVGRVLTSNGITRYGDGLYTLIGAEELSDSERDALLQLCRQRLDGFSEQRGEEVFAHRSRHRSPISGSVKVRVLTRARGRCECWGARLLLSKPSTSGLWRWHRSSRRRNLPSTQRLNQGGSDDISNLQAPCFRCNAGKRDTDRTNFRGVQASYGHRVAARVFCALEGSGRVLLENELAVCIADAYPESEGHSLVIPRRHVADGLELHQPEWNAVVELLKLQREQLSGQDASISGWTVGLNSGEAAGQTVFHAHWHLIPPRDGDTEQPRGEARRAISMRASY
jgi:diadenosine tetraphosphate (Ap4A) HIT family hydrolase